MNRMSPASSLGNGFTRSTGMRSHSTSRPASVARGSGSIAVMRVASPPSATARARKRVECPEPTSTMRRGCVMRTMAYAAAASRRGNQSWFQRGAGGGADPIASRSAANSSIEVKSETIPRHEGSGQLLLHLARDAVEQIVVVLRVVVEHREALGARGAAQAHAFLPGRMAPADVGVVLGVGIHAVVDHEVRTRDQAEDVAVGRARHV